MVDIKEASEQVRRGPTAEESARWMKYQKHIKDITPIVEAVITLGKIANSAQMTLKKITGQNFNVIDDDDEQTLNVLSNRIEILNRQISGVYLKDYAVKFENNDINIVALKIANNTEQLQLDTYPIMNNNLNFGVAPIIIAVGIAAVTLLIAGDQAGDRLESKAKLEAIRLQRRMVKADLKMVTAPEPQRAQWDTWKKSAAVMAEKAVKASQTKEISFLDMIKQKGSTAIMLVLLAGAGVLAFKTLGKKGSN